MNNDPSWWDGDDWLMAVDLGYDESGSANTLLVSMQLGTVQKAKKMKKAWKAELAKHDLPFFHSVDYKKIDSGIFKRLNLAQREALLAKLSRSIRMQLEIGITVQVDIALYNSKTDQLFRSRWGTAYSFAIHMLVLTSYIYCKHRRLGSDVNILIEGGHRHADQALAMMEGVRKLNGQPGSLLNVLTVGIGAKKDHPILQAADMLAYSEWQNMKQGCMEIYNALHVKDSQYSTELVDGNKKLIDISVTSVAEYEAGLKAWGQRRIVNSEV